MSWKWDVANDGSGFWLQACRYKPESAGWPYAPGSIEHYDAVGWVNLLEQVNLSRTNASMGIAKHGLRQG